MKVAGLNNLGFQAPLPKAAGGKASQGKEKSSFESVLGQTQAQHDQESPAPEQQSQSHSDSPPEKTVYEQPLLTANQGQAKTKVSGEKQASAPIATPVAATIPGVQKVPPQASD